MGQPRERRCVLYAPRELGASCTPVFGLYPVERTVLAFLRAGVRDFLVAGDPGSAQFILSWVQRGNCARARVRPAKDLGSLLGGDELFFLARADTQYDRRLILRFAAETAETFDTRLAVDFRADALAAHDGAARVALFRAGTGGMVRTAARRLVAADGVLLGLAFGTRGLARALAEAVAEGRGLDHAVATLALREPVESFAVAELWQELRVPGDVVTARRKVLAGAVGISDGVIARHLNRPISRRVTERLLSRNVKPWQVSVSVFAATLAAGLAFALGHAATGGLLAQAASVLDGVDGELARIRYQDSPFGGVYDALLDRVGDAAVIGGMTLYAWLMGAGHAAVALGFAAVAGSGLSMLVKEKYGTQYQRPYAVEHEGRLRWLLLGRDGRLFLALIAGLTGYVEAVLAYLAVGTHLQAGLRIYRIRSEGAPA